MKRHILMFLIIVCTVVTTVVSQQRKGSFSVVEASISDMQKAMKDRKVTSRELVIQYFTRIAIANERFKDEGGAGWRTDRGEVYVTLGEPDQTVETPPGNDMRIVQWIYTSYRAQILFQGQLGFSRLRMTPASRAEFSRARAEVMRQGATR